jgi:hypothetical protein
LVVLHMSKASCASSKNEIHGIRSFEFGKTLGAVILDPESNDWRKDSIFV